MHACLENTVFMMFTHLKKSKCRVQRTKLSVRCHLWILTDVVAKEQVDHQECRVMGHGKDSKLLQNDRSFCIILSTAVARHERTGPILGNRGHHSSSRKRLHQDATQELQCFCAQTDTTEKDRIIEVLWKDSSDGSTTSWFRGTVTTVKSEGARVR